MHGAKLSEYKFLKILRGFAEDKTVQELAGEVRVSEKTVRATYKNLRLKLLEAALTHPHAFGGAGFYLFRGGSLGDRARRFVEGVAESELYAEHLRRHAPRIRSKKEARALLFEVVIRLFCNLSMREGTLTDYPPDVMNALIQVREISTWIKENMHKEGFFPKYGHVVRRFEKVTDELALLLEKEELLALKTRSRAHHYPWSMMYEDLRRELLFFDIARD